MAIFTRWDGEQHLLVAQNIFDPESFQREFALDFIRVVEATPVLSAQWMDERSFKLFYLTSSGVEQEVILCFRAAYAAGPQCNSHFVPQCFCILMFTV
ncbi:MAG: hypothetical protein FWE32_01525 [Oscillospiraceae bacterium]|nr:hypothetical protein [Oscillospiraceae bacterium]